MSLQFKRENNKVMLITGDIEEILTFVDIYQDNLWPESKAGGWRQHEPTVKANEIIKDQMRNLGVGRVDISSDITRKAFIDCF